ncbi:hypothetical protein C8R45DRAFT_932382 [Mycena sanguinolenta]|nr:hypothetical protein C8R45DRAFT_932382 [Mycena sanguinolenta]
MYHPSLSICKVVEACLNLRDHTFDLAKREFEKWVHGSFNEIKSISLEQLANIKAWPASQRQSRWPVIYLGLAYKIKEKLALHKALLFLGDVFIVNKDEDTACTLYTVALEGFTYMDVHRSRTECMLRLGDLAHKHGLHWKTAQPLFEMSAQAKGVAEIDSRLAGVEKPHNEKLMTLAKLQPDLYFECLYEIMPVQNLLVLTPLNLVPIKVQSFALCFCLQPPSRIAISEVGKANKQQGPLPA